MESQYDSDMSEDTRECVEQGLAISRKKHSRRADRSCEDRDPALICNMDTANVHYPLAQIVPAGKTFTHGRIPVCGEIVTGQIRNNGTSQVEFEGVSEPRGNIRKAYKTVDARELTDEEIIRAYDELEREMRELKNNIRKRIEAGDTEAINAWRTRVRGAREKTSGDIEERAMQLEMAAEKIRKRTYAGARVIEIAPIHDTSADKPSAKEERVEALAQRSSIERKPNGETKRVKIEGVKTEPERGSRVIKIEKRVMSERMETSEDSGKTKRKDRGSGSSKSTGKNRDTSSGEDLSGREEHKERRANHKRKSRERGKKSEEESDSEGDKRKTKHRGKGKEGKGKHKMVKRRRLKFATDGSSEEETS